MAMNITKFKSKMQEIRNIMKDISDSGEAESYYNDEFVKAIQNLIESAEVQVTAISGDIKVQGSATAQVNSAPIILKGNPNQSTGGIK